ncbi:lysine-N-methylase [Citrobacter sp. EC_71]|uniref:lysine-N-methylase n=1 Tax=Citrobacter sp. EC_71 TaxID=2584093 RepID=UPI0010C95EFB|nr:lysine-N-methylase [Citrobacter sp. EC_71]MBW9352613.1 lysine-N-methylase [Citrobacter sp. EC_71]TKU02104.1 lysine-N-methylase [Citrobacter sp. wls830]
MSMIDCYEPDFVRLFLSHHPDSALLVNMRWKTEVRQSLVLTDPASCQAALGDPNAFVLHHSKCAADPDSPALSPRDQVLNQSALNTITLPGLSPELRLYALGITLSFSEKCPGNSEAVLEKLASLPQILAGHVQEGKLQDQFAQLPSLPQLQRELITRMGSCEFNWDLLPESTRKLTLPLQVSLLMLQDANSEALLQQQLHDQWCNTHETYFVQEAWIFSNYLIYRLYHDMFPQHDSEGVIQRYFELVCDFFMIRTMLCLWTMDDSILSHEDIYALFAVFEEWRSSNDAAYLREYILSIMPGEPLLSAFSLITR